MYSGKPYSSSFWNSDKSLIYTSIYWKYKCIVATLIEVFMIMTPCGMVGGISILKEHTNSFWP
jgi:hypothetical protein